MRAHASRQSARYNGAESGALAKASGYLRIHPSLGHLRQAKHEAFAELMTPKIEWKIEWGVFSDERTSLPGF
jgi:hypothetical protein